MYPDKPTLIGGIIRVQANQSEVMLHYQGKAVFISVAFGVSEGPWI